MQQGESTHDKVRRLRALKEGEKLSLIFTQQRKLSEFEERIEAFQCAHQTGVCPLCRDKDLTIAQLQQQNEQLRHKLYGRSSERSGKDKPQGNGNGKRGNPNGGASQRTRLPSERFPNARVQEITLEDPVPPSCDECEQQMTDSGMTEDPTERIEYQPAELYIVRTRRKRYHCKCCQSALKTAILPERIAPGSSLGDSLIIQSCISKFYDLIPTSRFAKILARGKVDMAHTLLLKAQSHSAFMLIAVYRTIRLEILSSQVIFADETVHRQLEENGGKWRWYLWGFSNGTSIYFEIHDTRAGDVSIQFLIESMVLFLVSDAYSGYSRTIREVNEQRQPKKLPLLQSSLCNDHGRRYFFYAQEAPLAKKALDLYDEIYKIEDQVQELLKNPVYEALENSAKALELRQTADPLFEQIHDVSCEILLDAPDKSLEATAAKYFINHEEGLTLFLRHIELPISNALSERGIRDWVQLRKTALGNHSLDGAEEAAIQLTVMCSCKMAKVNPQEYMEFTRLRYLSKQPLLTPAQYKQYLQSLKKEQPPDSS
jgi:transposase